MPRVGMNPRRYETFKRPLPPALPVQASIVHLPDLTSEYHRRRLDIVRASMTSAVKRAGTPAYHVIWDNGSVPEIEQMAKALDVPLYVKAQNIGKQNAMIQLARMFPGALLAISDDDILHYPGWLAAQLRTFAAFEPYVGLLSGVTTRFYMQGHLTHAFEWAREFGGEIDRDSDEYDRVKKWDVQHGISIGHDAKQVPTHLIQARVVRVARLGEAAYIGGSHCQFVTRPEYLLKFLRPTQRYMEPLSPFDGMYDEHKLVRLLTAERTARHIGNVANDFDMQEITEALNE